MIAKISVLGFVIMHGQQVISDYEMKLICYGFFVTYANIDKFPDGMAEANIVPRRNSGARNSGARNSGARAVAAALRTAGRAILSTAGSSRSARPSSAASPMPSRPTTCRERSRR